MKTTSPFTQTADGNGQYTNSPARSHQSRLDARDIPRFVFPFGKHKGRDIGDVPSDYLVWCLDNMDWLDPGHEKFNKTLWEIIRQRLNLPTDLPKVDEQVKPREAPIKSDEKLRRTLKTWYASMSRRFHPDLGGSAKEMIVVNLCYDSLIELLEGSDKK
jgi:hypothetical protein